MNVSGRRNAVTAPADRNMSSFENEAASEGYRCIAGVDEAGRGPLAGPVVAAAVVFPRGYRNPEINDSKKLSVRKRETLDGVIRKEAVAVGVGLSDVRVIDSVNILQATLLAMKGAVDALSAAPDYLLIDGLQCIDLAVPQKAVVRGDALSVSIAAASIIAKVARDRLMADYHLAFPCYNFLKNKGYGTKEHRDAIVRYGRCALHRRSFHVVGVDDVAPDGASLL
jgi:ribonuclease HII